MPSFNRSKITTLYYTLEALCLLDVISTITRSVHRSINLQEVLENAVEAMSKNIDKVQHVAIYLVEGEEAVMKSDRGYPDWFVERVRRIPYPKGFTWKIMIRAGK